MKLFRTVLLITSILSCQNGHKENCDEQDFSYSILGKDSLSCSYVDLSETKLELKSKFNFGEEGSITLQKFKIKNGIFFYKHNFAGISKLTTTRDAVELHGVTFKIDSLFYANDYSKEEYFFASLINIGEFIFNRRSYIAFFIQDIAYPASLPNTLILLFDVSDKSNILYIPIGFQASEDLKCFNDFNNDSILDFAKWSHGYGYTEYLYRYELNDRNEFIAKEKDFVFIREKGRNHYTIDISKSKWKYWKIK